MFEDTIFLLMTFNKDMTHISQEKYLTGAQTWSPCQCEICDTPFSQSSNLIMQIGI